MAALVVGVQPWLPGGIEGIQGHLGGQGRQKLHANGAKKSFYFSFSLRLISLGVDQGDGQLRAGMLEMAAAIRRAVIDIEFARQAAFEQGLLEGIQKSVQVFRQVEGGMRDQTAVVVDKGDQIGFATPALDHHARSVHHIRLPDVVGQFGLELAPVHRRRRSRRHQAVAGKKAPYAGWCQAGAGADQPPPVHGLDDRGHGSRGHFFAQLHQVGGGLLIDAARFAAVASVLWIQGLEFLSAGVVACNPVAQRAAADAGAMRKRDIPFSGALFRQQGACRSAAAAWRRSQSRQ